MSGAAANNEKGTAMRATLQLRPGDQVAIALRDLEVGTPLDPHARRARDRIPFGHKVALEPIALGTTILRFGQPIGSATRAIASGEHVHVHNMDFKTSMVGRAIGTRLSNAPAFAEPPPRFSGFLRPSGKVGTRNYIGVLTSVNCSALVARQIADHFRSPQSIAGFTGVDGVARRRASFSVMEKMSSRPGT
jgi:altronate hydrolase